MEGLKSIRLTALAGLVAAVTYAGTTLSGSALDPSYSQIRQPVSDLTATGAETAAVLAPAYIAYNVLVASSGRRLAGTRVDHQKSSTAFG
jgi:hypothetical protein